MFWVFFANDQETFWRISDKLSPLQLRSAAAALTPGEDKAECSEGLSASNAEEDEDEKDTSGEQRAQALRALLLARKRKNQTKDAGVCERLSYALQNKIAPTSSTTQVYSVKTENTFIIKLSFAE